MCRCYYIKKLTRFLPYHIYIVWLWLKMNTEVSMQKETGPVFCIGATFFRFSFAILVLTNTSRSNALLGVGTRAKWNKRKKKLLHKTPFLHFSVQKLCPYTKKVAAGKQVLVRLYSLIFWDHVLWTKIRQQQMMSKPLSKNVGGLVHVSCPKTSVQSSPSSNFSSNGRAAKKIFNLFW